jgi:hypothetical protein
MRLTKLVAIIFLILIDVCLAEEFENDSSSLSAIPICGLINASESITHNANLTSNLSSASFIVVWYHKPSTLEMYLISPEGRKFDSSVHEPVIFESKERMMSYFVPNPEPGNWTIGLNAKNVPGEREGYCIVLDLIAAGVAKGLQAE